VPLPAQVLRGAARPVISPAGTLSALARSVLPKLSASPRLPVALALLLAACAAGHRSSAADVRGDWRQVHRDEHVLSYHHPQGGTIAAGLSCDDADDVPLDVLINHLLIGIEQRREQPRLPLVVAGRAALRARLVGALDGVRVAMDLVVLKKDGCTYDLMLVSAPELYPRRRADFERFVAAFVPPGPR
jgi:hypothetical protein